MKFPIIIAVILVIVGTGVLGSFAMDGAMGSSGDCPLTMLGGAPCTALTGVLGHVFGHIEVLRSLSLATVQLGTIFVALVFSALAFALLISYTSGASLQHPLGILHRREDASAYSLHPTLSWYSRHEHSPTFS